MISEARALFCLGIASALVLGIPVAPLQATPRLHLGGSLGIGWITSQQEGLYKGDFNSRVEEVDLVRLKIEASPNDGWIGFLRLDAPSGGADDPPSLELGEASLRYHREWSPLSSVELRAFARQPQSLWLDHTLGSPVDERLVGEDVLGLRADVRWKHSFATLLAVDPGTQDNGVTPRADPFTVLRVGLDVDAGLRLGGTWIRESAQESIVPTDPATRRTRALHYGALDLTFDWRAVLFLLEVAGSRPAGSAESGSVAPEPLRPLPGLLADIPENGAVRAEIRAASLGSSRWGWIGFAPSLRVVGAQHLQRQASRVPQWGNTRRGTQSWQLEAWYRATLWPLWLRQTLGSNEETVDVSRRVDRWQTELETKLTPLLRGRLRWVSRSIEADARSTTHRDLVVDAWFEERARRLRAQFGWIDVDLPSERQALALEYSTPIYGRWGAVARSSMTREDVRLRHSLFAELQYWHLPQFEFAVSYGSEVFGDAADPVLDADQIAAGEPRTVVRVHFRGWF